MVAKTLGEVKNIANKSSNLYTDRQDMTFKWNAGSNDVQWNLSITTTFMIKFITYGLSSNVFNEDGRYQFTLANNCCLLELI